MALTPLAVVLYEKVAEALSRRPLDGPTVDPTFDDGPSQVIIAGYGRFGQIAGRLLTANGFSTTVLDSDIEQIDLLRRFGRPVHYGDATRLDLLRSAGAETAQVLIIALDDPEKTAELAEKAKQAFPNLVILARAFDRRAAYDLLRNGADEVERETFESALAMGRRALRRLGFRAHRAHRATDFFRKHDLRSFEELAPLWGEEERYILASRDAAQTMDRLLAADREQMKPGAGEDWDPEADEAERRARQVAEEH